MKKYQKVLFVIVVILILCKLGLIFIMKIDPPEMLKILTILSVLGLIISFVRKETG